MLTTEHGSVVLCESTAFQRPNWVTGCRADGVSGTGGLPSIAEGQCPAAVARQLDPNFRTNPSGSWDGGVVPFPDIRAGDVLALFRKRVPVSTSWGKELNRY